MIPSVCQLGWRLERPILLCYDQAMLSKVQEKLIRSLRTNKGRQKTGLCLVEGEKAVEMAAKHLEYVFSPKDTAQFEKLVTTQTPQSIAAVARIPSWEMSDILKADAVVVLDGVQDPGNVGSIVRLCLGFQASLILVDSADISNPKVIRSSAGAMFHVPSIAVSRAEALRLIEKIGYPVYRLEKRAGAKALKGRLSKPLVLVAGSEARGITLDVKGQSIFIEHERQLESLNVGQALAIALYELRRA